MEISMIVGSSIVLKTSDFCSPDKTHFDKAQYELRFKSFAFTYFVCFASLLCSPGKNRTCI